jgi:molybdopterin-biosynthesis enzyme MoeA-like protein
VLAAILTIGNELVSGDTENTNASWLARRLESLGVRVAISASVPDELERIVEFVQRERNGSIT